MIEVSMTEILLFTWAIIATGFAFKFHYANWVTTQMMREILSNENVRNCAVNSWREFNDRNLGGAE